MNIDKYQMPLKSTLAFPRLFYCLIIALTISILSLNPTEVYSQISVNQASSSSEVEALVEDVLLGSCVTASNVSYTGPASASGTFNSSGTTFTMQNGILLTTGGANVAIGPNDEPDARVDQNRPGDADLTVLAGESTFDAAVLEFDFIPQDDTLTFRYVFASEEYPEWVGSEYNDVFGFFVSGPGISGPYTSPAGFPNGSRNIALIPGTTTPVAINNVNNGDDNNGPCENCTYYIENTNNDIQYDGYTTVLTAQVVVTPCQTYHIRLAVADAGDEIYDSGVFLEAGSFTSGGGITVDFTDLQVEEGCTDEYLVFRRVDLSDNSVALGATYTIGGTATMGVDYDAFPLSVTIPAGQDSVVIPINVPLDYTLEGTETIIVNMDQPPCDCLAPGSATLNVVDNDVPLALTTTGETTVCLGQSANLTASVSGSLPPYSGSWDNSAPAGENVSVSPTNTTTYTYTVTDACNSQTVTSFETVTVIRPDFNTNDQSQCLDGNSFSFTNTGASGGTVTHFWDFGDGNSSTSENPTHSYLVDGDYTVTHYVIFTASNCTASASALMTVFPEPTVTVSVDADVICSGGTDGALSTSVSGGIAGYGYSWSPGGATTSSISGVGVGTYTVTVLDANGCTDTGSGTVIQNDPVPPTITCPATANISTDAGLCTSSASIGTPTTDDNCGVANVEVDNAGPYSVGTTTVTWTVTDDIGNAAICTQEVVVTDNENPTITCPATANITTDADECTSSADIGIPTTDDNCGVASVVVDNAGPYSIGITTVTWTVIDVNGNSATCSQDVVVSDDEDPTILGCPTAINITPASSDCSPEVTWNIPQADDNCSATLASSHNSGDSFPVGTTTVTYTATDASGNTFSCSFDVTITPSDLVLSIDPSTVICGANISCNDATDGTATANVLGGCLPYTYLWSNGQTTQTATGLGAGTYTVTVTDANGSTGSESITLTEPETLEISTYEISEYVGGEGVSCNGASDGEIDIQIEGGATCGAYSVSWTGPNGFTSTSQNLTGLEAGTYAVTITDINGCSTSATYTISEPDLLVATCSAEDALCNGDANGSVSVSVDGGTAPYSYSWSNGNTDASQSGLVAGTYVVTVTDANGCTATCNATVGEPNILTAVVDVQDETLVNGCNGSATANPTGGTPPYSYDWSNGGTTQTITDLCAGTYTVTITDANGCEYTTSNIVNPPSCDLDVDMSSTDVDCNGGETGTATATPITVQNNTPFTYEWNNGATTQTLTGVTAGPYSVVVTDSIGCEASGSVVISEPTALSVTTVVVDEQNFEACDGSATATADGGIPPYSYEWSDGQTTVTASDLCPGTYTVTVTDANGCEETVTITVNPLLCTGFSVAINTESLSCFEAGDGSATAVVTGGTAPFTYSWSNGETTSTITGLDAGEYVVTVTDAVNCEQTVSVNVTQPALLETATAVDNVSCHGIGNGVVELTVTGGTPDYTFDWDNGATTEDLNGVGPGSYSVLVTDENGCTVSASAEVTEPDTLQASSVDVNPTCFEGNDGSIDLSVSGGLGPYLVSWDSGQNTADISGLSAGTYVATIVDQNGCIYTYSTTLTNPPFVVPTITADGPTIFCEGDSVTLTASNAASYSWSPNGETTQSITVYDSGDFSVSVVTEDGCEGTSASTTVSIFQVDPATITADGPTEFCDGSSVVLTASTGSSYLWMPNGETTQSITVTDPGNYSVTVTDQNGCESSSDDIEITVFDLPEPIVTADGPLSFCDGGSVTLTSSEAAAYSWAPFGQTSQSITVTESGIYRVTITNEEGCQSTSDPIQVIVNENPEPIITADGPTQFCEGGSVVLSGPEDFIYNWSPNGENTQTITVSESGDYQLTVTDEFGCVGESNIITVTEFDVDTATVTAQGNTEFCEGGEVILVSSPGASYEWAPNGETTQSINVTESGFYSVTVVDENGCESTSDAVEVIVNPLPDATITANGPLEFCEGDSVVLSAPVGFSYNWSPNGESIQEITVFETGTFTVTVIDQNECASISDPVSTTMFEQEEVEVIAGGPTEFCDGGQVVLTASAGDLFVWSPNGETTQSITVTESGIYTVSITDVNGCSYASEDSIEVTVNPLPVPIVTPDGPTEFCEGESVTLSSSDADAYLWGPNGENTQSITVTESGIYRVTVTDENGCQGTSDPVNVTVFDLPEPTITADGPLTICPEDSVTLTSSAADSYLWSPNGEVTQSITVSEPGFYSVMVVDANGCEGEAETVTVEEFEVEEATVTASGITEFCEGDDVTLTASGGTAYDWSPNGENTPSITVTETGTYSVIVTDQNGCESYSDSIDVTVFELPEPTITVSGPSSFCEGDSVTLTVTTGEAYLWEPNGETTQSITVYESGSYYVEVADANTCVGMSDTVDVVVFEPEELEIGTNGPTEFCDGNEVILSAVGGTTWTWFPNGETTQTIVVSESGNYVVETISNDGCTNTSDTITIEVFELPEVTVLVNNLEICEGDTAILTAISNTQGEFQWFENGSSIFGETDSTLAVTNESAYSVTITDSNGCTDSDDGPLVSIGAVPVATIFTDDEACIGDTIVLTASGGDNFVWSNGATTESIEVIVSSTSTFTVTASNDLCNQSSIDSATISAYAIPDAEITALPNGFLEQEHVFNETSGDSSITLWTWNFGDGTFEEGQEVNNYYNDEDFFTVTVTTQNDFGCENTDTLEVEIVQVIDIPNTFTPNDDGYNDHLYIDNSGVDNYELTIYNRWGVVMHYDSTGEVFWDGKTPAGIDAEAGTYFYVLNVINKYSEGSFNKTGTITIVR